MGQDRQPKIAGTINNITEDRKENLPNDGEWRQIFTTETQ